MGLRIRTNIEAQQAQFSLRVNGASQESEFAKLASGKRITKSADDAAGIAVAKNLEANVRGLRQAARNASDGMSLVQVAEGGLNETTNIMTRLRELSIQAASDTVGTVERGYLDKEYQHLLQEAERIVQTTTFNGSKLLTGDSGLGTMDFHVGSYGGELNRIQFDADNTNATTDNLTVSGTGIAEKEDAAGAIEKIDYAINKIQEFRAGFGSIQSRLQSSMNNIEIQALNQDAARSRIEDVDVADSSAKLAAINVLKQSSIATLAQANNIPMTALRLIN